MTPRVFVSLLDEQQDYHRLQAAEARAAGGRAGVSVDVAFAEGNALVQIHQLFEQIHAAEDARPVSMIVHSVTGEGLGRVARNAVGAGIGWIILNRRPDYVEQLRALRPDLPIAIVTPDHVEIGQIHGRQVRALAPKQGLILYVQGPPDTSAAQDRLSGIRAALGSDQYEWKVLNADWTEHEAEKVVSNWLRLKTSENRRPAVIVAQNDAMAKGARQGVVAHNSEWAAVPVIGCDALPDAGQRSVASGELSASVALPPTAGAAVDLVGRWLRDKQQPPLEVVLKPTSFPPEAALRRR